MILAIKKQHAFMQDMAYPRSNVEGEKWDVDEDWYLEGVVFVIKVGMSGVCDKLAEVQCIREDESEVVPMSVAKVIDLSRDVV